MNDFLLLTEYMEYGSQAGAKMVGDKEQLPRSSTLDDILKINKNSQNLNDAAKNTKSNMPFPITKNHLEKIAGVYADIVTLIEDFKMAGRNPVVKENRKARFHIDVIIKKFNGMLNDIEGLQDNFDGLDPKNFRSK